MQCESCVIIGHPPPPHFQSSFSHTSLRKSFTIPQARSNRHRHHQLLQEEPLISPVTTKEDTPPPSKVSSAHIPLAPTKSLTKEQVIKDHISDSISSAASEYSFDSRISTHIYPEDALYPRAGLFGLADCMSTRSRERKLK